MLRHKMNKIIRVLERDDEKALDSILQSGSYSKAFDALEDEGCIETLRDFNGNIHGAFLERHYATYQLQRQEIWMNRLYGFLAGIASSVLVAFITGILHI